MFERLSKGAVLAVHQAVYTAQDRGDTAIGTEHLLAGVAASHSPVAKLLDRLGAGPDRLRTAISDLDATALTSVGIDPDLVRIGPANNEWRRKTRHLPFTSAAKQTLQYALREAIGLKHRHVGAEHILLALISTPADGPARKILAGLGLDAETLRREVLTNLN